MQASFFAGSAVRADDLNDNFEQLLFIAQETKTFAQNTDAGKIRETAELALSNSQNAQTVATSAQNLADANKITADSALQPGDTVSNLLNDMGYLVPDDLTQFGVTKVNDQVGDVTLGPAEVGAVSSTGGAFTGDVSFPSVTVEGVEITADLAPPAATNCLLQLLPNSASCLLTQPAP